MVSVNVNFLLRSLYEMPPFLEGADYRQHFLVIHLVVAFHVREALGHEGYWVELSVRLELGKDRASRKIGSVAFEFEVACIGGEGKNGGGGDSFLEGVECAVFIW